MIKGKTVEEAMKITNKDISDYLGGMPEEKMHCSVMGRDAFHAAIACYKGEPPPREGLEAEIVCECFGVTEDQIRKEIVENGLTSVDQVTHYTKAGGGCGLCHPRIEEILSESKPEIQEKKKEKSPQSPPMTNIQKIAKIQEVIDREIRPMLQHDGGDLDLIDVDGNRVMVALRGTCASCPSSGVTIKSGIEAKLKELVHPALEVEEVA
jgi:NifU-like protein